MRRILATGALFAVSILPASAFGTPNEKAATADTAETAVMQADLALVQALEKGDRPALAGLLDEEFTWTDLEGQILAKAQVLQELPQLIASKTNQQLRNYGTVIFFTGTGQLAEENIRFVRVWVKRPAGWRALLQQDTVIVGKTAAPQATVPAGTRCENPCTTVPEMPQEPAAREVVASWQALEAAVNRRDADGWAAHVADEFVFNVKDNGNPLTKADRIATIKKQAQGASTTDIGTVLPGSMTVWVFGETAVMADVQQPTIGGDPYRAMRIWVKRDARWQLVYSQQTIIRRPAQAAR
ncbi:MAG: nuclear transport factor 2 family protein [Acidobacteriia bacterium]|nr:nuclear transport factor 2 family protein [Terriglobia bacterium]